MKKTTYKTQFRMGTACILLLFCSGASVAEYFSMKNQVINSVYKETEIYIGIAEATRSYVKNTVRPVLTRLLPPDSFIPEAMSTSFVGREVMGIFHKRFPEFMYKRAARDPRNTINQADNFELDMLRWFAEHPDRNQWSGMIKKGDRSFYARLMAIRAETECLSCHGTPQEAPKALRDIYGQKDGYGYKVGDVVAADSVYIPVDVAFSRIKKKAWEVFIVAVSSLLALVGLFFLLFNRTIIADLKQMLFTFKDISGKDSYLQEDITVESSDELEQLKNAFETAAKDLKQTHKKLKASESKYRRLFEASQDAIFICDIEARMVEINEAGIKLFGFKDLPEALSIKSFYTLFWDPADAASVFETIRKKGFVKDNEVKMKDMQGSQMDVLITANLWMDEKGYPCGFEGTLRDITDKRRFEKQLAQTEKLASIGQLAAGVAHEINNPIEVIKCYSNLIEKSVKQDSQTLKDIRIIKKHTEQCRSVIDSLLNFARNSDPRMEKIDIHACIEEMLSMLERQMLKEKIVVRRQFGRDIPLIVADVQKMEQVFMNLLINARQAMQEGGEITIRTALKKKKNVVIIEVEDTGCGIYKKNIGRIFDPFFTTKEAGKGTGLGLSVIYGIIKQHEGEIEVKSSPGKGSIFKILISAK